MESDTDEAVLILRTRLWGIVDPNVPLINLDLDYIDICASGVTVNANFVGPGIVKETFSLRPSVSQLGTSTKLRL